MGQYYYTVLREPATGKTVVGIPFHFDQGLKLLENGIMDTFYMKAVMSMLIDHPMNVAWVGDYAEPEDLKKFGTSVTKVRAFIDAAYKKEEVPTSRLLEKNYNGDKVSIFMDEWVMINHTKKEFVDLKKYVEELRKMVDRDKYYYGINPLAALTAIGNGKGGGDFWGTHEEDVGRWACDAIELKQRYEATPEALIADGYTEFEGLFIEVMD